MAIAERELTAPQTAKDWTSAPYHWTVEQFCEAGEGGVFEGHKVMLIEGEILAMPAMNPPHQSGVSLAAEALRAAFGEGFFAREQAPLGVNKATDPEPDVAPHGFGYRQLTLHRAGEILQPLAAPNPVAVSLLLP